MNKLEPTYLRYVIDNLIKGTISAENAAALPQGLIGLYEQEFTQKTQANEREKVLTHLGLWALFKTAVSTKIAAAVLGIDEPQVKEQIDRFSSWFNSPESGKYQLYHERLRLYLLQKLSNDENKLLNEKIISTLKKHLSSNTVDEIQTYGLQFLGYHQLIETAIDKSFEDFIETCLNDEYVTKQIAVSKSYDWSKDPIREAIRLAAFEENKDVVFESVKSLVHLNDLEKEGLSEIQNLLDNKDDEYVIARLDSVIDGTKESYSTSYLFHILSIAYILSKDDSDEARKRLGLFIDNIEHKIPNDLKIVDHALLIPSNITTQIIIEFLRVELELDFLINRCSAIEVNSQSLSSYSIDEIKALHEVVQNHFHDDEIDFLVSAAQSVLAKGENAEYFLNEIEGTLEQDYKGEESLYNTTHDYHSDNQMPEELIRISENRLVINYCCETYLKNGTNKCPKDIYKEKFTVIGEDDLNKIFPFPDLDVNKLFELRELLNISELLMNNYKETESLSMRQNIDLQVKIQKCLFRDYGYSLDSIMGCLKHYQLNEDIDTFIALLNPYKTFDLTGNSNLANTRECVFPALSIDEVTYIDEISSRKYREEIEEWGRHHFVLNKYLELDCYLKLYSYRVDKNPDGEKFEKEILSNLREIERNDDSTKRNFETDAVVKFLLHQGYKESFITNLISNSQFKSTARDLLSNMICLYYGRNKLEIARKLLDISDGLVFSRLIENFLSYFATDYVTGSATKEHFDFIESILALQKYDTNRERYKAFRLLVGLAINSDFSSEHTQRLENLVFNEIGGFSTVLWKFLAIKYWCSESVLDTDSAFRNFQIFGLQSQKLKSDEIHLYRLPSKLPEYSSISLKSVKKKVAIHCIKNNFCDYFIANKLREKDLFSNEEIIHLAATSLHQENLEIFFEFMDTFDNPYDQLALKNELFHFMISNSLPTSKMTFEYEDDRISKKLAVKAIQALNEASSLEQLMECISELDLIEDDEVCMETFEVIDGSAEKVKSLFFIVNTLWKIGETTLAREQLKSAYAYFNEMEYETEKEEWSIRLDRLAYFVLSSDDLYAFMKDKIQGEASLTTEAIESLYRNQLTELIESIFIKEEIDRTLMIKMVNAHIKYRSLEDAFEYVKQIRNPGHAIAWRNIVVERVYSKASNFDGSVSLEKYSIVFNAAESIKSLEQMLKLDLLDDLNSEISMNVLTSKYDGYLTENELTDLVVSFEA